MKFAFLKNPVFRFLVLFILLYASWYVTYETVINPYGRLDSLVINASVYATDHLLKFLGYSTFTTTAQTIRVVGIDGTHGLWIGDPCDGITLFALFSAFILAFPGPWRHKSWFIPTGIAGIFTLNVLRIAALCLIVKYKPSLLEVNHDYIFKILVYAFIFWFWIVWVKQFSGLKKIKSST